MYQRSKTARVLRPVIVMATRSGTPAFTRLRTAVRRQSWRSTPGTPAFVQAVAHAFRKSRRGLADTPAAAEIGNSDGIMRPVFLNRPDAFQLVAQEPRQLGGQVHHPPLIVLRGPGIEPDGAGLQSSCRCSSVSTSLCIRHPYV
jgi:hypothetical protein